VRLRSVGSRIYTKLFEFGVLVTLSFISLFVFFFFFCAGFWSRSLSFVGSVDELVFGVHMFFFFFFFFFLELLTNGAVRVSPSTHAVNAVLF
jgi:hypothetical protein